MGRGHDTVLYTDRGDWVTHPASIVESVSDASVTLSDTVTEAVETFESDTFDCVVTSTELPDGDFRDLVTSVRERTPDVPVVVVGPSLLDDPLLDEQAVRFVQGTEGGSVGRVVADQIDSLLERADRTDTSLAAIPAPAFAYDGEFVDWNDDLLALLGRDADWLAEQSLSAVLGCTAGDLSAAADDEPLEVRVTAGNAPVNCRLSVGRDGDRYVGLLDPHEDDDDAEIPRAASILSSLLASIPLAIYVKDEQGRHVAVSDHQVGLGSDLVINNPEGKIHHTPEDVLGKTDFDLYPAEDAKRYVEADERVMEAPDTVIDKEHAGLTSDEEDLALRDMKAPWYDDGEVVGTIGVTLDVTEKHLTEQRAGAREEILETVATILRTQIRPLVDDVGTDDALGALRAVLADVETLLETRRLPESGEPTELTATARAAWDDLDTGGATLSVTTNSVARADPDLLGTLFTELFENAVRHCDPEGTVVVGDDGDGFFVEDDGPGIDRGRRSDAVTYGSTTADERRGSGLAVVDSIARAHGWSTAITTGIDGGTRVTITGVTFH